MEFTIIEKIKEIYFGDDKCGGCPFYDVIFKDMNVSVGECKLTGQVTNKNNKCNCNREEYEGKSIYEIIM